MAEEEPRTRAQEVGERIVQARRELGMSQIDLGELIGAKERSMQAYESGERVPWKRLKDLERVLNKPIAWFLHGDESESSRDTQLDEVHAVLESLLHTNQEILSILKRADG